MGELRRQIVYSRAFAELSVRCPAPFLLSFLRVFLNFFQSTVDVLTFLLSFPCTLLFFAIFCKSDEKDSVLFPFEHFLLETRLFTFSVVVVFAAMHAVTPSSHALVPHDSDAV